MSSVVNHYHARNLFRLYSCHLWTYRTNLKFAYDRVFSQTDLHSCSSKYPDLICQIYLEVFFLSTCERISPIQSLPITESLAIQILSHIVFVFVCMNVKLCQLLYITHLSRQTSISQVIFFKLQQNPLDQLAQLFAIKLDL